MSDLVVRPEQPQDFGTVRDLDRAAFGPESPEADLVEALRDADAHLPELCLVALRDGQVAGHVFFTRAALASGHDVLALAPMAVLPALQRSGIGSALVRAGLRLAAETGFAMVVVVGHPGYYPRFGFRPAEDYGVTAPWDVPAEAWMAYPLPAYRPAARGMVQYAEPFSLVT